MTKPARGFILLYVVAMTAALSLILFQLQQRGAIPQQTERQLARALQDEEIHLLLDFVISGYHERKLTSDPRYQAYRKLLAQDPARSSEAEESLAQLRAMLDSYGFKIPAMRSGALLSRKPDSEGNPFPPAKAAHSLRLGETTYTITIHPANSLPNLNRIDFSALVRLLELAGLRRPEVLQLAADIVDWVDNDDFSTDQRGAEYSFYQQAAPGFTPRNAPFRHWQELAYVRGMTAERLQLLRDRFFLGATDSGTHLLVEYADAPAIAALSGVAIEKTRALLVSLTAPGDKAAPLPPDIQPAEAAAFNAALAWKADTDRIRIEITGGEARLAADYDIRERRLLGRW